MTATSIRQKLYDYIRVAEDRKIKAIYTMLEDEIDEVHDYWNDKVFIADVESRSSSLKTGKVAGVHWEKAKTQIAGAAKSKKR